MRMFFLRIPSESFFSFLEPLTLYPRALSALIAHGFFGVCGSENDHSLSLEVAVLELRKVSVEEPESFG